MNPRLLDYYNQELAHIRESAAEFARDQAQARKNGVSAGGMIMIHGTPVDEEYPEWMFHTLDWTEGCIAMRNIDMREVWAVVKDGTLIEIRP